jgi:glyoxylase-like metal-dependent hydrolase (beta-lactamase superfamily II)
VQDEELIDGIRIHTAPGHTPGNILFEVEGENLWLTGDLFHHPAQIAHPEWPSADYDVDKQANTHQRQRFFKHFSATQAIVFPMHLGEPWQVKQVGRDQYFASPLILEQAEE